MAARVGPRRGESAPNSRRGAQQRVDGRFPGSKCVGCDFPSQGGAPQRNSIRSRPVHSQNGEMLGLVGPELVASPSSRRTSPVAMAWFLEAFDTADLNRGKGRCSTCCRELVKIQNE